VRRVPDTVRLFGQGLSLALLRRPRSAQVLPGFGAFAVVCLLGIVAYVVRDLLGVAAPRQYLGAEWLWVQFSVWFAWLGLGWLAAKLLGRPAAWLTLACLLGVANLPWMLLSPKMYFAGDAMTSLRLAAFAWLGMLAATSRTVGWVGRDVVFVHRLAAAFVVCALATVPWVARYNHPVWTHVAASSDDTEDYDEEYEEPELAVEPEALLGQQPARIAHDVAALRAQTPGAIDLYAVGFAGDGTEPPFRNEVDYLGQLLARRFGAQDRTLALINSPDTIERTPLATLTNLRAALAGIAARIDPEQDIVLVFLTSHGSRDHELVVDLPPLPLEQVDPHDLRAALDDAGIHWRVVVVSACYSGGFVDALRDPQTLVITAARRDRTSFGCGAHSQITWFGEAFLTEALNQTTDLSGAFAIASRLIRERELAGGNTPSVPQIWTGSRIGAQLAAWRAGLPANAPKVPFAPGGVETPAPHAEATTPH
jgi:hypothetical protein